jgi:enterobactin synthetase component D / holo-[acyl-carrier protein] synthase
MHPATPTRPPGAGVRLLPADVAYVETTADRTGVELFPSERQEAAGYAPLRRAEFATGRACARDALIALGLPPAAIVPGPAGDPVWPARVVGSITHCVGYRAAAVGLASSYVSIGIDAEPHLALPPRVIQAIADPRERADLDALPADGTAWDRVLFCAKEAAYKAWFPIVRQEVLATGIDVRLRPDGTFGAVIADRVMQGRWTTTPSHVHTTVCVTGRKRHDD